MVQQCALLRFCLALVLAVPSAENIAKWPNGHRHYKPKVLTDAILIDDVQANLRKMHEEGRIHRLRSQVRVLDSFLHHNIVRGLALSLAC